MSVLPCWGASLGGGRAATLMLELWHMYILECPLGLLSEQGHGKISRRENTQETIAHEGWEQGRREHMQSPWETEAARVESGVLKVYPMTLLGCGQRRVILSPMLWVYFVSFSYPSAEGWMFQELEKVGSQLNEISATFRGLSEIGRTHI